QAELADEQGGYVGTPLPHLLGHALGLEHDEICASVDSPASSLHRPRGVTCALARQFLNGGRSSRSKLDTYLCLHLQASLPAPLDKPQVVVGSDRQHANRDLDDVELIALNCLEVLLDCF